MFFCVARENLRPRHAEIFSMPCACRGVKNFCAGRRQKRHFLPKLHKFCIFDDVPSSKELTLGLPQINLGILSLNRSFAFLHFCKFAKMQITHQKSVKLIPGICIRKSIFIYCNVGGACKARKSVIIGPYTRLPDSNNIQ